MVFVIDRFEGQWAVIEYDRKTFNIPKDMLPNNAKEGDIITFSISLDIEATKKARQDTQELLNDLFKEEE